MLAVFVVALGVSALAAAAGLFKSLERDRRRWRVVLVLGLVAFGVLTLLSWAYFDVERPCVPGHCPFRVEDES